MAMHDSFAVTGQTSVSHSCPPSFERLEPRLMLSADPAAGVELFGVSQALFVENQGQWTDSSIAYAFCGDGANVLFTDSGPVFELFRRGSAGDDPGLLASSPASVTEWARFSVQFDGAQATAPTGLAPSPAVFNYCVGDQSNWRMGVPAYEVVAYEGLYDGIDLYTQGRRDALKYEFHVAAGADYSQIRVSYEGAGGLYIDADGALHVATELGELVDEAPYIYQDIAGRQVEVAGAFMLIDADTYAFDITGAFDPAQELIIDPDLGWSSYMGDTDIDYGYAAAVDSDGAVVVAGYTAQVTPGSSWVSGGYDTIPNGLDDAFVAKLNVSGEHVWSTLIGGSDYDYAFGVAVDSSDNILV
ncbi:MAG: LEPR-XLL domain-containing protein, partial [Planctomycetes bacterium]|nr:LEPR-XLL domain-containing protein [Planctomycetota bacterium]